MGENLCQLYPSDHRVCDLYPGLLVQICRLIRLAFDSRIPCGFRGFSRGPQGFLVIFSR